MTLEENNEVLSDVEAISALNAPPDEQPVETTEQTESSPEPEAQQPQGDDKLALLERVIATNPALRETYLQERYGIQPQYTPQQQQYTPELPKAPEPAQLPFTAEDYDPTNLDHTLALINHSVSQSISPLLN
jgi:hypothetical protein